MQARGLPVDGIDSALQVAAVRNGLRAYAVMLNTLRLDVFEPWLADGFTYESQKVLTPTETKTEFLAYMQRKLELIRSSGKSAYAELGEIAVNGKRQPCVILAQPGMDDLVGIALAKAGENGKLARIDLCIVPPPEEAIRSGEYPVAMA